MAEVVALALGIAASPFPVVPAILLLFSARPRPNSLAFLAAWYVGIAAATTAFALLAEFVDSGDASPTWLSWVRLVLGAALVVYGLRQWVTRHAKDEVPGWMRSIQDASPPTAARLALLLSVANPKVVLLAAAAGLDLGAADASTAATALAVVAFAAVASVSVAVPVLAYAVAGDAVLPPFERAKDWLLRNSAAVMAVVITVIGVVLASNGIAGL